jgi:hypothetical protein
MMDDTDSIGTPPRTFREQVRPGRVERLLIVRPDDAADEEAARSELEDLPGVVGCDDQHAHTVVRHRLRFDDRFGR